MEPRKELPSPYINILDCLLEWNLRCQGLTAQDVPQVLEELSPEVRVLNLRRNQLGAEGATAVADMLKTNSSLITIDLTYNQIKEEGATALADMLKTNSSLTDINLSCNPVGQWGGEALYASIAHNDHLETLWIDNCLIPSEFKYMSLDQVRSFTTALEHG